MTDRADQTQRIPALNELRDEFVRVARTESRAPSSRRLRRVAVALASFILIAAGATAAGIILTKDADRVTAPPGPRAGGFEASGPRYASLPELVAKTDLIVVGTVQEVVVGKVFPDPAGEFPTRDLNTTVRVDEVLKGSAPSGVVTVVTDELAFSGPGPEEWRRPAERVLLFLSPSREPDTPEVHILANTNYYQTAYVIQGEDLVVTLGDPLSERIATLTLAELRKAVQAAQ